MKFGWKTFALGVAMISATAMADYKIIKSEKVGGPDGMDYITVDGEARKLFVPRSDHVVVYNADTLEKLGQIDNCPGNHGVAIDTKNHHGFISGNSNGGQITVFDTETYKTIKQIAVGGRSDGIMIDMTSERVYVGSHAAPSITVINAQDNSIVGTIDNLGESGTGNVEGCASDGKRLFCNLEKDSQVAIVDEATLKVTDHWKLGDGEGPTGIGFDAKTHRLFCACGGNGRVVVLNTDTGAVVKSITCGAGADSGGFNPITMEGFSANGDDGTLTIVKENSADDITLEQNLKTMPRTRSMAVDPVKNQIYLATFDTTGATSQPSAAPARGARRGGRAAPPPDSFTLLIAGQTK